MKVALGQSSPLLGDFKHNAQQILDLSHQAQKAQADLVVFPELALLGYAPYDLLERPELIKNQNKEIKKLAKKLPKKIYTLFGAVLKEEGFLYNGAYLYQGDHLLKTFKKELLPSYDVFYDKRHFRAGRLKDNFFTLKKKRVLVSICEDIWAKSNNFYESDPFDQIKKADVIVNLSASPFTHNKAKEREKIAKRLSQTFKADFYYSNMVGGQDELIFDGSSFAYNTSGKKSLQAPSFKAGLYSIEDNIEHNKKVRTKKASKEEQNFKALTLGIKDYFKKTGFKKAHLGLSGGIDSALVLVLAAEALGSENVSSLALPGPYSSKLSLCLAQKLSKNLGCDFHEFSIDKSYSSFLKDFEKNFGKTSFGLMQENLQARLRALALMAFSNREASLLLATSNKSELAVGYSTLYGDQCGALMPIGDLLKTEVFELCRWYNDFKGKSIIPEKIITRPPSAELRPNQKDSDSLPPYPILDKNIDSILFKKRAAQSEDEKWILKRSIQSEFKRWQACPILKVSNKSFGRGRMMPLAHQLNL